MPARDHPVDSNESGSRVWSAAPSHGTGGNIDASEVVGQEIPEDGRITSPCEQRGPPSCAAARVFGHTGAGHHLNHAHLGFLIGAKDI